MAHLWIPSQQNHEGENEARRSEWTIARLPGDAWAFVLTDDPRQPVRLRGKGRSVSVVAHMRRIGDRQNEMWVLQSPKSEEVRVNGFPLIAGIRVLEDLDEVRIQATGRIYFSNEETPRVEPFPGREEATPCPRCKGTIAKGDTSVQCPQCKTWHHEGTEMPCWSYAEKCALCDQLTRLDTEFRWTPENL
jgi:hypothetical protein